MVYSVRRLGAPSDITRRTSRRPLNPPRRAARHRPRVSEDRFSGVAIVDATPLTLIYQPELLNALMHLAGNLGGCPTIAPKLVKIADDSVHAIS
jgi:hypothetical protein